MPLPCRREAFLKRWWQNALASDFKEKVVLHAAMTVLEKSLKCAARSLSALTTELILSICCITFAILA